MTICTQDRTPILGELIDGAMRPTDAGRMVENVWRALPSMYPGIDLDAFVVMPDHVHGIFNIRPSTINDGEGTTPISMSDVVHRFKLMTTTRYINAVKTLGWPPFRKRLWQRNFYERIVRDDEALHRIRTYIEQNPRSS